MMEKPSAIVRVRWSATSVLALLYGALLYGGRWGPNLCGTKDFEERANGDNLSSLARLTSSYRTLGYARQVRNETSELFVRISLPRKILAMVHPFSSRRGACDSLHLMSRGLLSRPNLPSLFWILGC